MLERMADAPWLEYLLEAMYQAQWQLLQWLHRAGLVGQADGQPAWPWRWRLSGEHLLLDVGQARAVLVSLAVLAALLVWSLCAWRWRALRRPLLAAVVLVLWWSPWPAPGVLLVPASPESFHTPAVDWSVPAIRAGAQHYARHCVQCHGVAGNGQGPLAAQQPVWPPNFTGPLLWRRADGDLFAHVRRGMRDRQGQQTMPGFAAQLSVVQTWEVLHYLRAQAAGQLLHAAGEWAQPVPMPDMPLDCANTGRTSVRALQGQRMRWVMGPAPEALLPDPRLVTVWVPAPQASNTAVPAAADCIAVAAAHAWEVLATLTGPGVTGAAQQLLVDRQGWLRARSDPRDSGWTESSLICTTRAPDTTVDSALAAAPEEDGLSRLLRRMDSTPVRFVKGGRIH